MLLFYVYISSVACSNINFSLKCSNYHKGNQCDLDRSRVKCFCEHFQDGILKHLKSKSMNPQISIHLDHDIWRFMFHGKGKAAQHHPGWVLLEKGDFSRLELPEYWWYALDQHGEGRAISFPMRARTVLSYSSKRYIRDAEGNTVLAPRKPVETATFIIARCQRGLDNLNA